MQETEYKRLIQTAKDRATFGFLALVQRAMQDAEKDLAQKLTGAKSSLDSSSMSAVRHFLRQDGNTFLRRVDALYRSYLDRAVQTMYVDFRPGLKNVSANELSLIDDETVNQQIEVGRLAQRMREANEETIGRLNVIVAQMHGQYEARERENPFRPYLVARSVYEAIKEIATDEPKAKMLFEYLSSAMIEHLPGFYTAIREVFEASGMQGRFKATRSRMSHNQRYFGAAPVDPALAGAHVGERLLPGLQRLFDSFGQAGKVAQPGQSEEAPPSNVEEFVRKIFNPAKSQRAPGAQSANERPANALVGQLSQFQKMAAGGQSVDGKSKPEENQLFALKERLDLGNASTTERMTVDVVAMLFEYILADEQIPADLRRTIGGLQIPVLKAAMLEPELLNDDRHPARELLNRLSSAAIGIDTATGTGQAVGQEINRIVQHILDGFETDTTIFASALQEFEQFLSTHLRRDDSAVSAGIEVVEAAEKISILLTNTTNVLCDVLLPLNIDKRISDFAIHVWPHVLVQAAWKDAQSDVTQTGQPSDGLYAQYHAVLPELIWSVQAKRDPQERSVLIKLLPGLVKRINAALQLIQMPDDERQEILNLLVEMHTQVLRPNQAGQAKDLYTLDDLRQKFSRLTITWKRVVWEQDEPPQARASVVEDVLAISQVAALFNGGIKSVASTPADREFLQQTYLLGTKVDLRADDNTSKTAQLVWVSTHRSLYLFKQEKDGGLVIHTFSSLLEALADGSVFPVEYAPVFERAVESLLFSAEKLQSGAI